MHRLSFAQVALVLFSACIGVCAEPIRSRATTCNGASELCSRGYGTVTFIGAHDSYAVGVNNLFANQDYDVTQQLNDGVRMLQMQAHNQAGTLRLCHTDCAFYDGGTLQDYLKKVKAWMDQNPNDVVSLLIVNIDDLPSSSYDPVFKAAGVDTISFVPDSATVTAANWPTLGSMIDSGKRLVTFLDNGADFTTVPYLIDEFTNIWETAFDVTDTTFDCNVNRTKGDTTTQMYLINHFLDVIVLGQPAPDPTDANKTNAATGVGSVGAQVDTCVAQNGRPPNFILVDFYEYGGGSVFQVAATLNGVTYSPTSPIATPITSTGSPTGSTTSNTNGSASWQSLLPSTSQLLCHLVIATSVILGGSIML